MKNIHVCFRATISKLYQSIIFKFLQILPKLDIERRVNLRQKALSSKLSLASLTSPTVDQKKNAKMVKFY